MQSWLSDINTFPPKLLHNIVEERVCSFSDASRVNKSINEICGIIETATRWPTDAHIYFSKKVQQEGFGKHKDWLHKIEKSLDMNFISIKNMKWKFGIFLFSSKGPSWILWNLST